MRYETTKRLVEVSLIVQQIITPDTLCVGRTNGDAKLVQPVTNIHKGTDFADQIDAGNAWRVGPGAAKQARARDGHRYRPRVRHYCRDKDRGRYSEIETAALIAANTTGIVAAAVPIPGRRPLGPAGWRHLQLERA